MVRLLIAGEVKRLVLTNLDRLLRFGAELIFSLCEQLNVEVVIINHDVSATPEQELVQDVLEIITVFSAQSLAVTFRGQQPPKTCRPDRIFALARALHGCTASSAITFLFRLRN